MKRRGRRVGRARIAGVLAAGLALAGCAALDPAPVDLERRLAAFPRAGLPLQAPVTVRWSAAQVPFIEAQTDRDLAFTLGLVHAHLRAGQIAFLRRVAQGRVSEMAGPFANDLDHALRALDLGRAAETSLALMPPDTRAWLDAFVEGLNFHQRVAAARPPEAGLLGLAPEAWTARDVLSLGRLAAVDVNWFVYFAALGERRRPDWARDWQRVLQSAEGAPSFTSGAARSPLADLLLPAVRAGSNSVVVAPARSATGSALIANDPHLGQALPNFWLLAGMRSPSFELVGMMVPGLPFVAVGRNPRLAWGGTNMRAASSELVDVAGLDPAAISSRELRIATRGWFDAVRTVRGTPFGPVITDLALVPGEPGRPVALRWMGHAPSDEITPFLRAARATDVHGFRAAFAGYAVSGQNLLAADADGNIAQVLAVRLPRRPPYGEGPTATDIVVPPAAASAWWSETVDALDLPWALNPAEGFIASANNRPTDSPVPVGFYFSHDERVRRLQALLRARPRIGVAELQAIQRDARSTQSAALAARWVAWLDAAAAGGRDPRADPLRGWDGDYRAGARAPVLFETMLHHLVHRLYARDDDGGALPAWAGEWEVLARRLEPDLQALPPAQRAALLDASIAAALGDAARFADWGAMHRLVLGHPLRNLPLIGGRFVVADLPVDGSRGTVLKSAHGLERGRHATRFGQQSRHVSDLGDPDANHFVLLGGNDGWLGSSTYADQVPLWQAGTYLQLPLRPATVERLHPYRIDLVPVH